jgi:ABC-type amino acid transport system permease subunit
MRSSFLKDSSTRKWIMQVLVVLLLFGLMAWLAWLYYDYELKQIKRMGCQFISNKFFPF